MARRLTPDEVAELLARLDAIERDESASTFELCAQLTLVLRTSYALATDDELQSFANLAARQVYAHQALRVPAQMADSLERVRARLTDIERRRIEYPPEQLRPIFDVLRAWLFWHNEPERQVECADVPLSAPDESAGDVFRLVVTDRTTIHDSTGSEIPVLVCTREDSRRTLRVHLNRRWRSLATLCWRGAIVHVVGAATRQPDTLVCTDDTIVVLQPDLLLDVTTVAECFTGSVNSHLFALWRLLQPIELKESAIVGTIVNACFDELLANPGAETAAAIDRAARARYLDVLAALKSGDTSLDAIADIVGNHLGTIRRVIEHFHGRATTEPTFIAPLYGIQGRLDVLLQDESDRSVCNVVELKSGSPPPIQQLASSNGKHYTIGMRPSHAMQVAGYNLLLDAAIPGRQGTSSILYSQASDDPLRNAPNVRDFKADFIAMRNAIVATYWAIAHRRFGAFEKLATLAAEHMPELYREELLRWQRAVNALSEQESLYVRAFVAFALREWIAEMLGNSLRGGGFSSLWQVSIAEKTEQLSSLTWLRFVPDESDLANGYLAFSFTDRTPSISPFRSGDIAVLYPHSALDGKGNIIGQVYKCTVRRIGDTGVVVSLRNKLFDREPLQHEQFWALDADVLSVGVESMVRACADFVRLPTEKRQLLLGNTPPRSETIAVERPPHMTDTQYELLCRALGARDYFLLEGPPGTGKTRTMLRTMVARLLDDPRETILCAALTNRAVDEICSALAEFAGEGLLVRMGTLESTEHADIAFAAAARSESFDDLAERLDRARIVVATVPFLNANPALFELKAFSTAIVDEAAQLLEPHLLGVVSRVERFIMIGDACQLPAVVQQEERCSAASHPLLDEIELRRLNVSLFERLLRIAKRNGWHWAHGRLTEQARMHRTIAEYPGRAFYGIEFGTVHPWQKEDSEIARRDGMPLWLCRRLVFIETPSEPHTGYNRTEAAIAAACAARLARSFGTDAPRTIGIVTPFRKQIRTIVAELGKLARTVTVDTVERFQGSERDHIILSCAVNAPHELKLIESPTVLDGRTIDRKLNVALTRARQQVIVIGNAEILRRSPAYAGLVEHIRQRGVALSWCDALEELSPPNTNAIEVPAHAHSRD
ncbi:MAG: AAA domain-containing protein [Chlorobi bacterium]|nr:AAA domain-containing protein [Chlorobiota bacterium]